MKRWRPVPGVPGYWVSDHGEVKSFRRGSRGLVLRATLSEGYPALKLWGGGQRHSVRVYQLVAKAFLGPRPEGLEVRHLDGDKLNSALSNLQYGSRSENMLDLVAHGGHNHARKTHCHAGHELTEGNTYRTPNSRVCRECARARRRAYVTRQMFKAANVRGRAA